MPHTNTTGAPYFIIHVPRPVMQCASHCVGRQTTWNSTKPYKMKSPSNLRRDQNRLEKFLERKSFCAVFPFNELSDQELKDALSEGHVSFFSPVEHLRRKLNRAESRIKRLTGINILLGYSVPQLIEENETLKMREQELESEKSDLSVEVKQEMNKEEALQKKLSNLYHEFSCEKYEHFLLKDKCNELQNHNLTLQSTVSDLETSVDLLRNQQLQVQPKRRHRPPDRSRGRTYRNRQGHFGHC